jgi:hypothetical protein
MKLEHGDPQGCSPGNSNTSGEYLLNSNGVLSHSGHHGPGGGGHGGGGGPSGGGSLSSNSIYVTLAAQKNFMRLLCDLNIF